MKRKIKTVWCYLDGKKHCDVVQWAQAANIDVAKAKQRLTAQYPGMEVTFRYGSSFALSRAHQMRENVLGRPETVQDVFA